MQTRRTFADFIHAENAVFKHAKGMRDIFGLEFHPFHEIFLFLDGDAEFISGDFRTVLQKNTLVVIPKESFHHFVVHCAEEDYHRYVLNFTPFGKLQRLMEEKLQEICVLAASDEILAHFARLAAHTEDADRYMSLRGVVPSEAILPTRFPSFSWIFALIALRSASPERAANSLSARYLSFSSLGVPSSPAVYAGETMGSASSQILPTGSLKAPSP